MMHAKKFSKVLSALVILGVLLVGVYYGWFYYMEHPSNAPAFPHDKLTIQRTDGTNFPYDVEVATTMPQEMYGLMYRKSLPDDHGMIFVYQPDQPVSMWMKNTFIPLDMLFVRKDGVIVKIITHAVPLDLAPLSSDEPVRAVIEINDGEAAKHGLKTGDKVLFSAFDN
jgi:uncharacterized membrane protein (UPF0127 family)